MKKILKIVTTLLCAMHICLAQTSQPLPPLQTGWKRIYIKNVGSFDIPPTMEVQSGKYREYVDEMKKIKGFDAAQLTAQQKGLNQFSNEGYERYARVIVETTIGSIGDFDKLNFNIAEYSQTDINEMNAASRQQIQQSFRGTGIQLIEWYPIKIEKVNGMSCFHISYKRQFQDQPIVFVHMYGFQNNDRMHKFTLSYRITEADYWQSDFAIILKSFRVTNIR